MAYLIGSILMGVALILYPIGTFILFDEEFRKTQIITYQTLCEIGAVLVVGYYCLSNWSTAKATILPLLLASLICFTVAEFGFNTTFFQKTLEAYRNKAICAICYSLSFGILAFALFRHFKISIEHPLVILGIFSVAFVHFGLQYRFLLIPLKATYFSKLPYFMYLNGICYSLFTALVTGIAATYCLRALDINEHLFLHILLALLTFDFAARYQLVQGSFTKMTYAQCFWATTVGALFLLLIFSFFYKTFIFSQPGTLADWFSIRVSLALLVFIILSLLTIALAIIRFFTINNAVDLTLILATVLFCWSISNFIAFNLFSKVVKTEHSKRPNEVSSAGIQYLTSR